MVILIVFIDGSTMYAQEKPASPKYALSFGIAGNFTGKMDMARSLMGDHN